MPKFTIIIHVEAGAPAKPVWGAPCNGCGVCCLVEPCPLGVALSGRRRGSCQALRWDGHATSYRCGAITEPVEVLRAGWLPVPAFALALLARWLPTLAYRWVSAGTGCDCDLDANDLTAASLAGPTQSDAPG
jgi:uncharacterized cysteine cluster protein YcgN (CxxCxxCC family)